MLFPTGKDLLIMAAIIAVVGWAVIELMLWLLSFVSISLGG